MSAAETLYTARTAYPNLIERARAQVVTLPLYRDGALFAPTQASSTYSLYKPDGTAVVSAAAVTVSGSVAQYAIPAATLPASLEPLGEGWREEWALVISGETTARNYRREAALVLRAAYPTVTDADLTALYPDLVTQLGTIGTNFQAQIDAAWARIVRALLRRGFASYLIVDMSALHDWLENEVLASIFRSFWRGAGGDRWKVLWDHHAELARDAAKGVNFTVDSNHDGKADDTARTAPGTVIHPNAAPSRSVARSTHW